MRAASTRPTTPNSGRSLRALWACLTIGAGSAAAAAVLAAAPFHDDIGQSTIDLYVASIESNDLPAACRHASAAADHYARTNNAAVGEGWQTIAQAICSTGLEVALHQESTPR